MSNGAAWRSRLMTDYWFANLPADLQDSLLNASRQRRRTPGKLLFEKDDAPCGFYVLLEGGFRMGSVVDQRLAPRLEEVRMPYWFGEVSLFDGLSRTHDAYSQGNSIFLHIPHAVLIDILEKNPAYWRFFAELLSQKLGLTLLHSERIKLLPAKARVAWRLLLLSEGYGPMSHARRLITLDDIQSMRTAALSRPALLEVLQELHTRKILRLDADRVEIFDVVKLRKAANFMRAKSLC
ncbi:Crp/Fnr family transcriptional regulator [Pseudomonas sp. DSP3-2-2]|uniref:Crp/Fnr family transcriptional regulator n=1 Tax=unclassified Pseudomonas TaxID=196821 RepID=UPI003CEF2DA3